MLDAHKVFLWDKTNVFIVWSVSFNIVKSKMARMAICFLCREENIVGKGENTVYQHCLLFRSCFQKTYFQSILNSLP